MDALEAILTRRSTRKMRPEIPEISLIEKVIEAGRNAPCGSNSQKTHFTVITDKSVLDELAVIARESFSQMEVSQDTYVSLRNSILASKKGNYVFHYNAPVLIVTSSEKSYGNAMADSACAIENMMIAANALDLGSCYINQLHWLDEDPSLREYIAKLGIPSNETITASLILGYSTDEQPLRTPKTITGNPVTWIM